MFNSQSIGQILKFWTGLTLLAIVLLSLFAYLSNNFLLTIEHALTQQVLPMENSSRQMGSVLSSLATRQKQMIATDSSEALDEVMSRQYLENHFEQYWQHMVNLTLSNEQGQELMQSLYQSYKQFLVIDTELMKMMEISFDTDRQISHQIKYLRRLQTSFQENITLLNAGEDTKNLIWSIQLNILNLITLIQQHIQTNGSTDLIEGRDDEIQHYQSLIDDDISALKQRVGHTSDLQLMNMLEDAHVLLSQPLSDDALSLSQLLIKQQHNLKLLQQSQQKSVAVLTLLMTQLDQLSALVSEQSLYTVTQAANTAQTIKWLFFLISMTSALAMMYLAWIISRRINAALFKLRSAMHALTAQRFDTRLTVSDCQDEFAILAADFNTFASNNQQMIQDLAEAKATLHDREQQLSAILNSVPEAIMTLNRNGVIQSTNPEAARILKADQNKLIGLNLTQFFDASLNITSMTDVIASLPTTDEYTGCDFHKMPFTMRLSLNPISSIDDDLWVCVFSDITALQQAQKALSTKTTELNAILENAMVGIAFIKQNIIVQVNQKFEQLFGYDRNQIEGQTAECLYPSFDSYKQLDEQAETILKRGESFDAEVPLIKQDGHNFWCSISSKAIDSMHPHNGTIWLFEDITQQRENDEKLRQLASVDALTGLPNRSVFNDRLEHAIHKAHRNASRVAVFFMDLDYFKNINDSLGHKAGDSLLKEVSQRLRQCVREADTVARLGGDEFTVILEEVKSAQYVAKIAEKISETIADAITLESTEVNIGISIGISLFPADGRDVDTLIKNADAAMYHAKKQGRNNFQFYSADMNAEAAQRLAMETSLRRAVDQDEFYLHFQPQIDLLKGHISGAEALLRWHSEQWGEVSPVTFIPILEDIGLINAIGELVLQKACEAYMSLKNKLSPDFKMSVNLSGRQFRGGQLTSMVKRQLDQTGMSPNNLELEITESILMDDAELAVTTLKQLSDLGITLAIDDFGTGYSSLSYLKRFPLDILKIDRSFVRDVNDDADDAAIVDAILAMSRRLKLEVIAEGVETPEQLAFLKAHGCYQVQGYFFSKPLVFEAFNHYIMQDIKYA